MKPQTNTEVKKKAPPQTLVNKESSALAMPEAPEGAWGKQTYSSRDIMIPKILCMQGLSKLVLERKAQFGDFMDSLNFSNIGSIDKPLEFIPFLATPVWHVFEEREGKSKFLKTVPVDSSNDRWEYESISPEGRKIKRDRAINVFCLLPVEISKGMYLPYCISFRRTSLQAGKKIITGFTILDGFGKPPAAETYELSGSQVSNDKGTFIVLDVKKKRPTTKPELGACYRWYQTLAKTSFVVDESDLETEEKQAPVDDERF